MNKNIKSEVESSTKDLINLAAAAEVATRKYARALQGHRDAVKVAHDQGRVELAVLVAVHGRTAKAWAVHNDAWFNELTERQQQKLLQFITS